MKYNECIQLSMVDIQAEALIERMKQDIVAWGVEMTEAEVYQTMLEILERISLILESKKLKK